MLALEILLDPSKCMIPCPYPSFCTLGTLRLQHWCSRQYNWHFYNRHIHHSYHVYTDVFMFLNKCILLGIFNLIPAPDPRGDVQWCALAGYTILHFQ